MFPNTSIWIFFLDLVPKVCSQPSGKLCMNCVLEGKQRSINVHSDIFLHEGFHQLSEVSLTDFLLNNSFLSRAKQQFRSSTRNVANDVSRCAFSFTYLERELRVM
jgi:hypothetical protein